MLAVHHIAVMVRDLARAEAFYTGVLGLPVQERWHDEQGTPRSVWVGLQHGGFLALEKAGVGGPIRDENAPGWHCLALSITRAERNAWRARLLAAGCRIVRESPFTIYTRDPDGHLVGLSHHPDATLPASG